MEINKFSSNKNNQYLWDNNSQIQRIWAICCE